MQNSYCMATDTMVVNWRLPEKSRSQGMQTAAENLAACFAQSRSQKSSSLWHLLNLHYRHVQKSNCHTRQKAAAARKVRSALRRAGRRCFLHSPDTCELWHRPRIMHIRWKKELCLWKNAPSLYNCNSLPESQSIIIVDKLIVITLERGGLPTIFDFVQQIVDCGT